MTHNLRNNTTDMIKQQAVKEIPKLCSTNAEQQAVRLKKRLVSLAQLTSSSASLLMLLAAAIGISLKTYTFIDKRLNRRLKSSISYP